MALGKRSPLPSAIMTPDQTRCWSATSSQDEHRLNKWPSPTTSPFPNSAGCSMATEMLSVCMQTSPCFYCPLFAWCRTSKESVAFGDPSFLNSAALSNPCRSETSPSISPADRCRCSLSPVGPHSFLFYLSPALRLCKTTSDSSGRTPTQPPPPLPPFVNSRFTQI